MIKRIITAFVKFIVASVIGVMSFVGITGNPDGIIQGLPYRLISNEQVHQIENDAYNHGYSEGASSTCNSGNTSSVIQHHQISVSNSEFPKTMYVTSEDGLYLRKGPGTENDAMVILSYGQEIQVERIENGWAYTTVGGYSGYCSTEYLAEVNESFSYTYTNNEQLTVYYTRYGECYHIDPNCTSLRRSNAIYDGDVNDICRDHRPCKLCMPYEYGN